MEEWNLESWSKLRTAVDEIREYGHQKQNDSVLFRGQKCATWSLETTLERASSKIVTMIEYLHYALQIKPELESFTGRKWDLQSIGEFEKEDENSMLSERLFGQNWLWVEFLAYLRHYGYPSPLLDWSTSPYVAAYFAFQELCKCELGCDECKSELGTGGRVAIFAYFIDSIKSYSEGMARIQLVYPSKPTHTRHYAQKAWYTVASEWSNKFERTQFCSHHKVFGNAVSTHYDQDNIIKITIPSSERKRALKELNDDYNINQFALFQTEDALVKTLSMRDFDLAE